MHWPAAYPHIGVSGNDLSVEKQDKIAIISNNRPEWLITDMAVQKLGAVLVPIYPTTNNHEIEFIFKDAAVKYVFVSNSGIVWKKFSRCDPMFPPFKTYILLIRLRSRSLVITDADAVTEEKKQELESISKTIRSGASRHHHLHIRYNRYTKRCDADSSEYPKQCDVVQRKFSF